MIETGDYLIQGYMVGNGVCDPHFDGNALVPFAYGMGLISDMMYKVIGTMCCLIWNRFRPMLCRMTVSCFAGS